MDDKNIVWVLGAGFSRPLGGPLLFDLFSVESAANLASIYDEAEYAKLFRGDARAVQDLYLTKLRRNQSGEGLWEHAEEFLEYLDSAATDPIPNRWSRRLHPILLSEMNMDGALREVDPTDLFPALTSAARRLLAAECSAFLQSLDFRQERWEPYFDFRENTANLDTIITFNYDLAVEHVFSNNRPAGASRFSPAAVSTTSSPHLQVVLPGTEPPPGVRLYKLHGSVDWKGIVENTKVTGVKRASLNEALTTDNVRMIVGGPGPWKKVLSVDILGELWKGAMQRLRDADAVVFIGYRFPESDTYARGQLLDALKANPRDPPVHIVLGPSGGAGSHQERMKHLLERVVRRVTIHPLYSQEFLHRNPREQVV